MTVSKITSPPSKLDVQDKINEIIDNMGGGGSANILPVTQEEYNNLPVKDAGTLYVITTRILTWGTSLWGTGLWGLNDD